MPTSYVNWQLEWCQHPPNPPCPARAPPAPDRPATGLSVPHTMPPSPLRVP